MQPPALPGVRPARNPRQTSASSVEPSRGLSGLGQGSGAPRGVTLVELMITIMIIGILASMILGVASVAGETAREAHSRHMVMRLHSLLTEYLDTFKTRRVKLNPEVERRINNSNLTATQKGQQLARARLNALREMMVMEVPDRWSDVLLNAVPSNPASAAPLAPKYLDSSNGRAGLAGTYLRRYMRAANHKNEANQTPSRDDLLDNQGAECLYMVITLACGDGEARTLFHESNIGDVDEDGAPEFLDGWGHPIEFLRWAPGFDSDLQLNANELEDQGIEEWQNAARTDHDPYDLFRAEPIAYRLIPLIYSAGRDESLGVWAARGYVAMTGVGNPASFAVPLPTVPILTPYLMVTDPDDSMPATYLGTDVSIIDSSLERTSTDNIHNHVLGKR